MVGATRSRRAHALPAGASALAFVVGSLAGITGTASAGDADDDQPLDRVVDVAGSMAPDRLAEVLADPAFTLEPGGEIVAADPAPFGPLPEPPTARPAEFAAGLTAGEALSLHSRPDATRTIFLDVDGHVTTGQIWNTPGVGDPLVTGSYSRDGVGQEDEQFSQVEIDAIATIWAHVAEDFAAWDVDVTTEDPGVEALRRTSPSDEEYGIRVVITHDSAWYGPYGGVAYLDTFAREVDRPAFVFSNNLGNGNPKAVAEAAAHEVGHTLGLRHDGFDDGTTSHSYYAGHGDWAPIMGASYYRPVTQWSAGDYDHADNAEDDLALIDGYLARLGAAAGWTDPTTRGDVDGVSTHRIARAGGTNVHPFSVTTGPTTVEVVSPGARGNLLARVVVRDGAGTVVETVEPTTATGWTLATTLGAGTYTVEVVSRSWQTASTGFTAYASIGRYDLHVDAPDTGSTTTTTPGSTTTTTGPTSPTTTVPGAPPTTAPDTTTTTPGPTSEPPSPPETPTSTTTTPDGPTPPGDGGTPPGDDPRSSDGAPDTPGIASDRLDPLGPVRALDTRRDAEIGRLRTGDRIELQLAGRFGVPADATAVAVNVVAVRPAAEGWLALTPCDGRDAADLTSALNFAAETTTANASIAVLSADGRLCVHAAAGTDVVLDVTGAIGPSGRLGLTTSDVRRVADSRSGVAITDRLAPGRTVVVPFDGLVDDATEAVALNVTAANPADDGFVTVDDCLAEDHSTAALNVRGRTTRGNNGVFGLGPDRALCVTSSVATDVVVDLTGEFGPDGAGFVPHGPARVLDTRVMSALDEAGSIGLTVTSPDASVVPIAVSATVTSTAHPAAGFVTGWGCAERPTTSVLNPVAGQATANGALLAVGPTGNTCLYHDVGGHLIVDVAGSWIR